MVSGFLLFEEKHPPYWQLSTSRSFIANVLKEEAILAVAVQLQPTALLYV